jgi:CheY-like chemotaxis protein
MQSIMSQTILIVEDEQSDVLLLRLALQKVGVANPMQVVTTGREALDYLEGAGKFSQRDLFPLPFLVLLDLKLPYVMGLDVLKWMRQNGEFKSTIVIVFSSSNEGRDVAGAYEAGANAYLVKPPSVEKRLVMAQAIKDFWLTHNQSAPEPAN